MGSQTSEALSKEAPHLHFFRFTRLPVSLEGQGARLLQLQGVICFCNFAWRPLEDSIVLPRGWSPTSEGAPSPDGKQEHIVLERSARLNLDPQIKRRRNIVLKDKMMFVGGK